MSTAELVKGLADEIKVTEARLVTLKEAHKALVSLAGVYPATASNGRSTTKAKPKPVVKCPDCGKRYTKGAGLAAHRRTAHDWEKGMPVDVAVADSSG